MNPMSNIAINPIPAFADNYIWSIEPDHNNLTAIVDPGDAAVVINYLKNHNRELSAILVTHHHFDHVGGIDELKAHYPNIIVYGPANCQYQGIDVALKHNDSCEILNCQFNVLEVPGHTLDHIAYHCSEKAILFCGDTLFAGGCGRVFEGTFEQMHHSLSLLAKLPQETKSYCAHEYTMANLKFAMAAEPNNNDLIQRIETCQQLRDKGIPTVPFTLQDELLSNPFIRVQSSEKFAELRQWKDSF